MKKTVLALLLVSMLGAASSFATVNPPATCEVSSDSTHNTGHCRKNDSGGDTCYTDGSGPACSGTNA